MNKENLQQRRRAALKRIGIMAGATAITIGSSMLSSCSKSDKEPANQKLAANVGPAAYTNTFPESESQETENVNIPTNTANTAKDSPAAKPANKKESKTTTSKPSPKPESVPSKPKPVQPVKPQPSSNNTYTHFD